MTDDPRRVIELESQAASLASQVQELVMTSVRLHDLRRTLEDRDRMYRDLAVMLGENLPKARTEEIPALVTEFVAYSANFECVVWAGFDGVFEHEGFWSDPERPQRAISAELLRSWAAGLRSGRPAGPDSLAAALGWIELGAFLLASSSGEPYAIVFYGCTQRAAHTSARVDTDGHRGDILAAMISAVSANIESRRASEAMQRAAREAEEANHAKSQFVANMTHELRTPLNAIIGYTELIGEELSERGIQAEFAAELDRILHCSENLLLLVNDVLDLAKVEAGELDIVPESFDLVQLFQTVGNDLRSHARRRGCEVEILVESAAGPVFTDRGRVRQIFTNLLANAVKFTEQGTVTVRVEQDEERIRFSVSDTGVGMSAEALTRIFQPFEQEDNSTTRRFGGTGLGLHITEQLVHRLGGTIEVVSERGVGSTFTVMLPARLPDRLTGRA